MFLVLVLHDMGVIVNQGLGDREEALGVVELETRIQKV